jgi:hypothetical protein
MMKLKAVLILPILLGGHTPSSANWHENVALSAVGLSAGVTLYFLLRAYPKIPAILKSLNEQAI